MNDNSTVRCGISGLRSWAVLAVMGVLEAFSLLSRSELSLFVTPIKADLGVSDLQIGFLYGTVFSTIYAILLIAFGRIADLGNRRLLVFSSAMVWGIATVASGLTRSYSGLVMFRTAVAFGEAALVPAAYSLIGDLFPRRSAPLAASVFETIGMVGCSLGLMAAGILTQTVAAAGVGPVSRLESWQIGFVLVGAPSVAIGLLFLLLTSRGRESQIPAGDRGGTRPELLAFVRRRLRFFAGLFIGGSAFAMTIGSLTAWVPTLLQRRYGWSVQGAGSAFGLILLVALGSSQIVGPLATRVLQARNRPDAVVLITLLGGISGSAIGFFSCLQRDPWLFLTLGAISLFAISAGINNLLYAMQNIVPPGLRGTFVAALLATYSLIGMGGGPALSAFISDRLSSTGSQLGEACAIQILLVTIPGFLALDWARRAMRIGRGHGQTDAQWV